MPEMALCSQPSTDPSSRMLLLESVVLRGRAQGGLFSMSHEPQELPCLVESELLFYSQGCGAEV